MPTPSSHTPAVSRPTPPVAHAGRLRHGATPIVGPCRPPPHRSARIGAGAEPHGRVGRPARHVGGHRGILHDGGNAVDAAIATNAVHRRHRPAPVRHGRRPVRARPPTGRRASTALNASGRAGSGADADALRAEGHTRDAVPPRRPHRHRARLRRRLGRAARTLRHAAAGRRCSRRRSRSPTDGFPASPLLVGSLALARRRGARARSPSSSPGAADRGPGAPAGRRPRAAGDRRRRRDGVLRRRVRRRPARARRRAGSPSADLARSPGRLGRPAAAAAFGRRLCTRSRPTRRATSRSARAASPTRLDLPDDPDDAAVGPPADRGRDGRRATTAPPCCTTAPTARRCSTPIDAPAATSSTASERRARGRRRRTTATPRTCAPPTRDGMGVSLIQSNASGFGSWLVEPNTGINLHNRGLGFSSTPATRPSSPPAPPAAHAVARAGHPRRDAGRRVRHDGRRRPAADPAAARPAPVPPRSVPGDGDRRRRWALRGPATGFDTWTVPVRPDVDVEGHAPLTWSADLAAVGHRAAMSRAYDRVRPRPCDRASIVRPACRRRRRSPRRVGSAPARDQTGDQDRRGTTSSAKRAICSSAFL